MAISVGEHLVFGDGGHLKRSSSNNHLLRRNRILKIGYNECYCVGVTRDSVYPYLYDNRYDVTWTEPFGLLAECYWIKGSSNSLARVYSSYAAYDTSGINGTSVASVDINVPNYNPKAGGGAFYVGFRTSSSGTAGASYEWITGASESFTITASGAQTKTFSSALTFDDYLFVTIWVAAYEPPTDNSSNYDYHYFTLSDVFSFNE